MTVCSQKYGNSTAGRGGMKITTGLHINKIFSHKTINVMLTLRLAEKIHCTDLFYD